MGEECCFALILFLDSDVIIAPVDVYNCEFGASTKVVDDLGNEGGYISIFLCPFIDRLVVLYWS